MAWGAISKRYAGWLLSDRCFRASDRLAGRDSHPLEIAEFGGILGIRDVIAA
jgi:hypothetical protein